MPNLEVSFLLFAIEFSFIAFITSTEIGFHFYQTIHFWCGTCRFEECEQGVVPIFLRERVEEHVRLTVCQNGAIVPKK